MSMNEADTRDHLIDPVLCDKGYVSRDHVTLESLAPLTFEERPSLVQRSAEQQPRINTRN